MAKKKDETGMNKVDKGVMGDDVSKKTTLDGSHLRQGEGTQYNQMAIGKSFLAHDPRAGHEQKRNIDDYKDDLNTDTK